MALAQVLVAAAQIDAQRTGYCACSLTNFDNALEPAVAQGAVVEVGGALYEAALDEAITGLAAIANDSDIFIKLTVAGASVTASGTLVAPTWDTAKQGFYSGAERYIGGLYKDAGGNYVQKWLYEFAGVNTVKLFGDGTMAASGGIDAGANGTFFKRKVIPIVSWNMDDTAQYTAAHGLTAGKIRSISIVVHDNTSTNYYQANYGIDLLFKHTAADVVIDRTAAGFFDAVAFGALIGIRGYITIEYEV